MMTLGGDRCLWSSLNVGQYPRYSSGTYGHSVSVGLDYDETRPKWRQVYAHVKERIQSGDLPPRSKVSEHRLVAEYGVVRDTIRKALRALREDGYVYTEHGIGSFVADEDAWPDS